jgi:polyketide cyclase/dehydrase/lipid transport protein
LDERVGRKRAERQIVIEGTPQECFDAIVDYESFPDWQPAVKEVEVLTRHRDGRGKQVAFEIDTELRTVRNTLDCSYEEPHLVSWRYVDGDRGWVAGELVLENRDDGTTLATFSLAADPGVWLPGLEDLKRRVEA